MKRQYVSGFTGEIQESIPDIIIEVFRCLWFYRGKWSLRDMVTYAVNWSVFEL